MLLKLDQIATSRRTPKVVAPMVAPQDGPLDIEVPEAEGLGASITTLDRVHAAHTEGYGAVLRTARRAALDFRAEFAATGTPLHVSSHDLVTAPYPTKFGLWRAPSSPAPYVFLTNRMLVVRWHDSDGTLRTLLWEPSDAELVANTAFYRSVAEATPDFLVEKLVTNYGDVVPRAIAAGIDPAEVDYVAFDHLHTQDVRRLVGTTKPQGDISPDAPVQAWFPNARLIVQRHELLAMRDLHPLQKPWYQPETFVDIDPAKYLVIDGDRLLAPGVALIRTPGHATGNQTLVLNTGTGIWTLSENAVGAECMTPEHSRIPGVAGWASKWGQEVVMNANTIETTATQYNFCIVEKLLADRSQQDERFLQFYPTSELTASPFGPGVKPTFTHGGLTHDA
ncbi:conserved hypothetical protein [Nostocoides japonicum T1-X7]|uniref:Metallo-beta-lactamase domain-containing protein n=1 Tax=Nostocoides japonicum T1-X7 TaxID=1194083 RepID=A0A077LT94_9MICO|nr:hypothetical protein [Tetrasphaera japonica]CCH76633.1 conserved hypothetical protein [Tetrasphaera japonica T1-X7]